MSTGLVRGVKIKPFFSSRHIMVEVQDHFDEIDSFAKFGT